MLRATHEHLASKNENKRQKYIWRWFEVMTAGTTDKVALYWYAEPSVLTHRSWCGLTTPHTLSASHTQTRAQTHIGTHKHPFTWILISPHVRMCISHTHSLIMYMCLHVTQHKSPCTCLSLSSTHIDTKNLLSLPQSLTYHTRTLSLSRKHAQQGFPPWITYRLFMNSGGSTANTRREKE